MHVLLMVVPVHMSYGKSDAIPNCSKKHSQLSSFTCTFLPACRLPHACPHLILVQQGMRICSTVVGGCDAAPSGSTSLCTHEKLTATLNAPGSN